MHEAKAIKKENLKKEVFLDETQYRRTWTD